MLLSRILNDKNLNAFGRKRIEMERFLKRKPPPEVPFLYKDAWLLLIKRMEWPEVYAFTQVSKNLRKLARPLMVAKLPQVLVTVKQGITKQPVIDTMIKHRQEISYYRWNFMNSGWDMKTAVSPSDVSVVQTIGFVSMVIDHKWRFSTDEPRVYKKLGEVEARLGADFARFCRISGLVKCSRPKSWTK